MHIVRVAVLLIYLTLTLFSCNISTDGMQDDGNNNGMGDCSSNASIFIFFDNKTDLKQSFSLHYYCDGIQSVMHEVQPQLKDSLKLFIQKNPGVSTPLPLDNCDITVLWSDNPITSDYQVVYPEYNCYPGDRYRTMVEDGQELLFQIVNKEPCEELNRNFSLTMENKLDQSVFLYLESGSVSFYSPTPSQAFNPQCNPAMCCQFSQEIMSGNTYMFDGKVTKFILHSIGLEQQSDLDKLITLFKPEEGIADSIVNVEIRGVVLDSLFVTYSN